MRKILRGSLDVEYPPTTPEKFNAARMTLACCGR
jgi:hypothetical protein